MNAISFLIFTLRYKARTLWMPSIIAILLIGACVPSKRKTAPQPEAPKTINRAHTLRVGKIRPVKALKLHVVLLALVAILLWLAPIFGVAQSVNVATTSAAGSPEPVYIVQQWSVASMPFGNCNDSVEAVRAALSDFAVPASKGFAWVVVCDEKQWFHLKYSSPRYARVNTISGFTDFENHVVYLNGYRRSFDDLRHTTSHEIGHQICHCADEQVADQWGMRLRSAKTFAALNVSLH